MDLEIYVRRTLEAIHKGVKAAEGVVVYNAKEAVEFDLMVSVIGGRLAVMSVAQGNSQAELEVSRVKFTVEVKMPSEEKG